MGEDGQFSPYSDEGGRIRTVNAGCVLHLPNCYSCIITTKHMNLTLLSYDWGRQMKPSFYFPSETIPNTGLAMLLIKAYTGQVLYRQCFSYKAEHYKALNQPCSRFCTCHVPATGLATFQIKG